MSSAPDLSPEGKRLLKMLDSMSRSRNDFPRGGEVMKNLGMEREPFAKLLLELSDKDLVNIAGPRTTDKIDFAVLSIHPANRSFVRAL